MVRGSYCQQVMTFFFFWSSTYTRLKLQFQSGTPLFKSLDPPLCLMQKLKLELKSALAFQVQLLVLPQTTSHLLIHKQIIHVQVLGMLVTVWFLVTTVMCFLVC